MEERILDLVLKGCWYDLIKSGKKREEYREICTYWNKRIYKENLFGKSIPSYVKFRRGYTNISMLFKIDSVTIGQGNREIGAPEEDVYIIKFSEIKKHE